jgi:hypothetical protein
VEAITALSVISRKFHLRLLDNELVAEHEYGYAKRQNVSRFGETALLNNNHTRWKSETNYELKIEIQCFFE